MIKIMFTDNQQQAFWVAEKNFFVGRKLDNHLVIDHTSISPNHACFSSEGENVCLQDLNSAHGTYVNDKLISKTHVACGDVITLGKVTLKVVDPFLESANQEQSVWSLIANSSWLSGQEFPIAPQKNVPIVIGRGKSCDLIFPSNHLSRQHAQITLLDEGLFIEDLNSVNGTFVNGERISATKLSAGDCIEIDMYSFLVFGPGINLPKAASICFNHNQKQHLTTQKKKKLKTKRKLGKTRPTSPGNRKEPSYETQDTSWAWTGSIFILVIFGSLVLYVAASMN